MVKIQNDIAGHTFGRLTVIEPSDLRKHGCVVWRCQCKCGNLCEVVGKNLRNGNTTSCGCLHREVARQTILKRLPTNVWKNRGRGGIDPDFDH